MERVSFFVDAHSKRGVRRKINQDCVCINKWISIQSDADQYSDCLETVEKGQIFLLADGLGGHEYGEVASREATKIISNKFLKRENFDLNEAIAHAHTELTLQGQTSTKPMGTTIVGLILKENEATFFNIGDSRGYKIGSSVLQMTQDDRSDQINQNVINKCLGGGIQLTRPYTCKSNFDNKDIFLLVSDGISNWIDEEDIKSIIKENHSNPCEMLCQKAQEVGSGDDVSAILVRIEDQT